MADKNYYCLFLPDTNWVFIQAEPPYYFAFAQQQGNTFELQQSIALGIEMVCIEMCF